MLRRDITMLLLTAGAGGSVTDAANISRSPSGARPFSAGAERGANRPAGSEPCLPGDIRRYRMRGDRDHTAAIQRALDTRETVFVPRGRYRVSAPLRFMAEGQILSGEGMSQSIVEYGGPPGGKVISISDRKINYSQCAAVDLTVDGRGLANVGIEGYDDDVGGGSWRMRIARVAVVGVSRGDDATAIKLGTGRWPDFAHDTRIDGCFLAGSVRGVWGAGAKYALSQTTVFRMSDAACHAASGSAWTFAQCIFSQNGWDFDGSGIQHTDFSGCWFEDSRNGIYRASRAHAASFVGCYLHTASREHMMDFGDAAGYHFIGGHFVPASTKSLDVVNVNPAAIGAVSGQPLRLKYAGNGASASLSMPAAQPGTGGVWSASAELTRGQALVLRLGRGVFFIGASVHRATSPAVRSQASYSAFLSDGDHEDVELIAGRSGSGGGLPFSLTPSGNSVTLTYDGAGDVLAYISGAGVVE